MLTLYRRHLSDCTHKGKGQAYTLCACPIWAYGSLEGKPYRKSLGTNDSARATRRMERLMRGESVDGSKPPVLSVAIQQYMKQVEVTASTKRRYEGTFKSLVAFADVTVSEITTDRLNAYRDSRTIAVGTWKTEIGHLRTLFGWFLEERKWITENPAAKLRLPKVEDLTTAPLTADEVTAMISACDHIASVDPGETDFIRKRARALVYALLYSGLRISDIAALERSALSGKHLTIRVLKTGVRQKVLLHDRAVAALNAVPSRNPKYFFWTGASDIQTCASSLRRVISELSVLAGIKAHPHQFRDTFAVELLTNGADIRTVQQLLGHKTVRTTEKHYAHFVAAHQALLDSAAATLDFERGGGRPLAIHPVINRRRNA